MCTKYAPYSIKSAGVVKLIGKLIQGRSDLARKESRKTRKSAVHL